MGENQLRKQACGEEIGILEYADIEVRLGGAYSKSAQK